jgi:hypothetical protein
VPCSLPLNDTAGFLDTPGHKVLQKVGDVVNWDRNLCPRMSEIHGGGRVLTSSRNAMVDAARSTTKFFWTSGAAGFTTITKHATQRMRSMYLER